MMFLDNQFSFTENKKLRMAGNKTGFEVSEIMVKQTMKFTHDSWYGRECYNVCTDAARGNYINNGLYNLISMEEYPAKQTDGFNAEIVKKWNLT